MSEALAQLQERLEHWHREAAWRQLGGQSIEHPLARCRQLEREYDAMATELTRRRLETADPLGELRQPA